MDTLVATVMIVGSVVAIIIAVAFFSDREVVAIPEFTSEDIAPQKPRYVSEAEERFHTSNQIGR